MTNKEKDIFTWAFDLIGYFNNYSFFTEKLWRKVEGFEYADDAEIKCLFMHYWLHYKFGYCTCPIGATWFHETTESSYNLYISKYKPIINFFEKWKLDQR